jgi:predicted RNA methylase
MSTDKNTIIQEIASAFSLSDEAAQTALLLLEARARTLDYTFDEYMQRYHPDGIAERDENLPEQFKGYVQFLGDDATSVLRAGKGANFSTFVHECAHVFRRQLTGELQEQAEKAFGVTGIWSEEKEELFAKGLGQWIKRRHGRDKTRADLYNKGKKFVDIVYRGLERIVEIDPRMDEVYERLFEDSKYVFKQNEFVKNLKEISEGKTPDNSHIFLGMTPQIYEDLCFQRLPMAITAKHLYTTLRAYGEIDGVNYHDLGEHILSQIPQQMKKPLCIVQSSEGGTDIISVIALKDKQNNQIIFPLAHSQKGNINGTEIDINLVKTIFGKDGFENWLKIAINDGRLLYIDKKKTEPALDGKLTRTFQARSIRLPDGLPHSHTAGPTTDVFGFTENVAQYREAVKRKFPERFIQGERILYDRGGPNSSQLSLDFAPSVETVEPIHDFVPVSLQPGGISDIIWQSQYGLIFPYPNIPENFALNFVPIAGEFKSDPVEAARLLLRSMTKEHRDTTLGEMRAAGCTDKESYHKYLKNILADADVLSHLDELDLTTLERYLDSAKNTLGSAKTSLIYNADYIVNSVNQKITELKKSNDLFETPNNHELLKQQITEHELKMEALLPDFEAAEAANHKGYEGPQSGAIISEYNEIQNEVNALAEENFNQDIEKNILTNNDIENEYHNIASDVLEMFPDYYSAQIFPQKTMRNIMDYGIDRHGSYGNDASELFERDVKKIDEFIKVNKFEADMNKVKPMLDRIYELGKLYHTNISQPQPETSFSSFGAWRDFNSRLSTQEREKYNQWALSIIEKNNSEKLSDPDKAILRLYSGFGGIAANDERGVLYDYYTSPPVAYLVWDLLEKSGIIAEGSKILEPSCGTGAFLEYAPKNKSLSFTGVELDQRTAEIARLLHTSGNAEILQQSFEAFNLSGKSGGFDHVIGNAPFGERSANLASLDMPEEKSLDNYFVARSIDNLRENGTMALIAAPGVLENKTNEQFRMELNRKAQFVGAVKLPDRSFHHTHTQVSPDILLFRKYPDDIRLRIGPLDDETFKETPLYDPDFVGGKYFEKHPEHIAGELSRGTGQWGNDEIKGDITKESLITIAGSFAPALPVPEDVFISLRNAYQAQPDSMPDSFERLDGTELQQLEAKTLRPGAIKVAENKVFILAENHSWTAASDDMQLAKKLNDITNISPLVHLIQNKMKDGESGESISAVQKQCRQMLLAYWRKHNNYPSNDPDIKRFTKEHPAVQGIYESLLPIDDPLLHSENVYRKDVEIHDGHSAAVSALLSLRERMKDGTEENIRASFPDTAEALIPEMRRHSDVFVTPEGCFQLREDFIAGDAWGKIDALKAAAEKETEAWKKEKILYGAGELEKAVGWTPIEDADFSPRSSWVPQEIVREWASGNEALGNASLNRLAKNDEGKWGELLSGGWREMADPLVYYLNGQKQRSKYYDTDSYNKEHDDLFRSFISNHETYRSQLESEYNRKFKTHIVAPVKTYPVDIAGWKDAGAGGKTLKPHQWQSVHHLYRQQCGISALGTGFGKTATAIALGSLLRQEGKAKRVFLQVPNNKVKDWVEEIRDVMPSLKTASIDPEEPGYSSRDKRYAKYQMMARSDADIIIMPESAASEIQLSPENDARVTQRISHLYRMEKADGTARQQESAALRGEYKAHSGKTNVTVSFEDFGCDAIVVDEAHRYKNLFSSTLSRETGLNDGRQSAKAMSLYKKCDYVRERNDQKNVFLLTATPLTNSPLEYYNMMQFVAPQELRRMGVATIDGFIHEFANIEMGWMYDWGSGQAKQGRILTGFKNLPTLQNLFFSYTDLQNNPDAIGLEKPFSENQPHVTGADKKQTNVIKGISAELDQYKSLDGDERESEFPGQNFLTFYSRMRTASLDLELYDPKKYGDWKNPKLETLAKNSFANFRETKGGQVIFCDRVFSSDASFNIHEKIKKELVSQGFKEKEIVIVNGFTKAGGAKSDSAIEKEVSKAIADYNAGKYKVIIGSTACIGEGVNLQKNSSAVHHFDIPFRPSDFIQRNGRVDRQGNEQEKVGLHTYLASGTIDNYSVNLVQRKANWIDQLLRTKSSVFTNPNDENSIDADELLLSLTEEWGDKDAALKRREQLEAQKQEKIREAQASQMKGQLKNLSLARGALSLFEGGKHSKEYDKRMGQINSLETSLKSNPVFDRHDLLKNREPFLYSSNDNKIYRKGDVIINRGGTYLVEGFNLKKQELECSALESDGERRERIAQAKLHGGKAPHTAHKNFTLTELSGKERGYSYNEVLYHFEKAPEETRETARIAGSQEFYSLPETAKAKHYGMHLAVTHERYGGCNPPVFSINDEGVLEIKKARYRDRDDGGAINPFTPEGKAVISQALEKGLDYSSCYKSEILETLSRMLPDFKTPVEHAIERAEAKEQEMALKEDLLKQAATKSNANTNHLKNRVHLVRC